MENTNQKLSFLEKVSYGVGDLACNLFWGLICMATVFYTDYFGISAAAAGTMILIISIIDICFDVIIGAIADRHKTKWGRFRPWILYGLVPFCVSGYLTFRTPEYSETGKLVYAYLTFLAFRLMYSVVNVPYGALMGVISEDPKERTNVSAYRNILAQFGCLLSYGFIFTFVRYIQDYFNQTGPDAFATVAMVYAFATGLLLLCTFFFTRERVEPVKQENSKLSDDIKDLCSNKPWIMLTIAGIAFLFFVFVHNSLVAYYAKYYVADTVINAKGEAEFVINSKLFNMFEIKWETVSSILLGIGSILTIVGTLIIQSVVAKFGKKQTWLGCFILASAISILLLFIPKESIGLILILNLLFTLSIGPCGYIMWSMYADVADNAEVETGRRATGLIYSSATMAQKLGNTLANSIPAYALAAIGYVANTQLSNDTISSIKTIYCLVPIIGAVIAITALCFYDIDDAKIAENARKLKEMKGETEGKSDE